MNSSSEHIKELFGKAVELTDAAERERFLSQACGVGTELRQQVESLLHAHAGAGDFLQPKPPPAPDFTLERTGAMIGRYKLLEKIGEGGFGDVFMAEQVEPVQRRVALKIIKAGIDTREVVARFDAERQALAVLGHFQPHRSAIGSMRLCQVYHDAAAVNFEEKAVAATDRKEASCLDALAAAYAETGQFAKAVSIQEEAIEQSVEGQMKEDRKGRLKLYRSNSPFRESRLENSLFWKTRPKADSTNDQNGGNSL